MFAVLCHLLGGQPARGTEMATLRWRNSVDEQRGVYWVNGTTGDVFKNLIKNEE